MTEENNELRPPMSEEEIDEITDAMNSAIQDLIQETQTRSLSAGQIAAADIPVDDLNRLAESVERARENRPSPWAMYRTPDEGSSMTLNNGSTILMDGSTISAQTIRGSGFTRMNPPRNEWQRPDTRMNDHYEDVMVNYTVPVEYADHVTGAVKILSELSVSACAVSHLVVPGHVYIEFTLLKHRIGPDCMGLIVNDIQKWHTFLSYMYAIQKGYEPLLWDDTASLSDQRIVVKNDYLGGRRTFAKMEHFYKSRGYAWKTEDIMNQRESSFRDRRRASFATISSVVAHSFLNIYELLETTEDRAEFAVLCGLFTGKKHGDMTSDRNYIYELATGKGTDIETHYFVVVSERHGNDVENMFFRRLSPTKEVGFSLSDKHKERWEEKTRKMISTNQQKENRFVLNRPKTFKGMRFTHV